jgi:uncharacterized protein
MDKSGTVQKRMIHLLYVPTLYCNLKCGYCYLDEKTNNVNMDKDSKVLETLQYAVNKFISEGIIPFNISLHGGEVTTLKESQLEGLFSFITHYYQKYEKVLTLNGFTKKEPHIKTNLYNFNKLIDLFKEYRVSISASIDLPLSMHKKYRLAKNGKPTFDKILDNLKLLSEYPYKKKFSSVICYEHYLKTDEIIEDIWKIHRETGFNMNDFNFMFGFESGNKKPGDISTMLKTLDEAEQLLFYKRMKDEFNESELAEGFKTKWFEEFTPDFCTNMANCGEKFFLLQYNGDIYSCVRGQSDANFYFGNIFKDSVKDIMKNAIIKIRMRHNNAGFDESCGECDYLALCKTGCPFVKYKQDISRSYTCKLQKELYKSEPEIYKPFASSVDKRTFAGFYKIENHPQLMFHSEGNTGKAVLPNDFDEEKNSLMEIIKSDILLNQIYSQNTIFEVNKQRHMLESQITKKNRQIIIIKPEDEARIYLRSSLFEVNCKEIVRNSLYLMLLRDTMIVYGDEKRVKQEHVFTHQIFYNLLEHIDLEGAGYICLDITQLLHMHRRYFINGVLNNFFVTTSYARDYHYQKQKENAFYHVQAINLPFPNIEFYWEE